MKLALALWIALAAVSANAQVHRCIDAGGKATYSDVPCTSSAKQATQVLGRTATDTVDDPYARERNLVSIERARAIQQGTVNSAIRQEQASSGALLLGRSDNRRATPAASPSEDTEGCETYSPRRGCYGGERAHNPNWSPRAGYHGGGGPADQRKEAQEQAAARALPTSFTGCDKAGCWSNTGARYSFVAGGNLSGPGGQFCTRGAGNTFSCNP
jgi:hypothetical protein